MTMIVTIGLAAFLVLLAMAVFIYWLKQHQKGEKKPLLIGLIIIYIVVAIACIVFGIFDNRDATTSAKTETASSTVKSYSVTYTNGKEATFVPMYPKHADSPSVLLINTGNSSDNKYSFKLENGATITASPNDLNIVRIDKSIKPYIKYKRYKAKYAGNRKNKQCDAKVTLYEASDKMINPLK